MEDNANTASMTYTLKKADSVKKSGSSVPDEEGNCDIEIGNYINVFIIKRKKSIAKMLDSSFSSL